MEDLLHGFTDPNVMDIKMGTRTFLESEVTNTTARSDLYQKVQFLRRDILFTFAIGEMLTFVSFFLSCSRSFVLFLSLSLVAAGILSFHLR